MVSYVIDIDVLIQRHDKTRGHEISQNLLSCVSHRHCWLMTWWTVCGLRVTSIVFMREDININSLGTVKCSWDSSAEIMGGCIFYRKRTMTTSACLPQSYGDRRYWRPVRCLWRLDKMKFFIWKINLNIKYLTHSYTDYRCTDLWSNVNGK